MITLTFCNRVSRFWSIHLLLGVLLASVQVNVAKAVEHPFMITEESDYEAMRLLADDPNGVWSGMKGIAINYITSNSYNPSATFDVRMDQMIKLMNCGSLAYILDPDNASFYADKLKTTLTNWEGIYAEHPQTVNFDYCITGGSAFMCSVLALDVIHDTLTTQELASIEAPMGDVVDWFYDEACDNWPPSSYAVLGSWHTYLGDSQAEYWNDKYRVAVEGQINTGGPDGGIYTNGVGYAWARFAGDRMTKAYYMDVLTYMSNPVSDPTGEDDFYNNPELIAFNEWLYGGAVTPLGKCVTFGDTEAGRILSPRFAPFRAGQFSELAGQNAAWLAARLGKQAVPGLLSYVAVDPTPVAVAPKSRVWLSGYAAFWEDKDTNKALAGYLWCPEGTDFGHAHKDVNALHLTGYGENLLFNSGYVGYGEGIPGTTYTWDWIHDQAESNNTVLVDGLNHVSKHGGGVDEGFTNESLDYACGNSGPALDATHLRNFIFIHPTSSANGYWILFDEIAADPTQYSSTQVLLHPNAKTVTAVDGNKEYRATINGITNVGSNVALTMFLGTAPNSVTIKKGGIGAMSSKSFVGEYLYSDYALDASGKKRVVTVLFPQDTTHAKAIMTRISGIRYTGASITQGNVVDFAIESDGTSNRTHDNVTFRGLATMYRMDDNKLDYFFVRKGRFFDDGQTVREGFSADADISLFIDDTIGSIISPGTNVTFYHDNITGLYLDDSLASVLALGEDWVEVLVPEGTWECRYEYARTPGDANGDGVVDGSDATILAGNWQTLTGASWDMGDFNDDGAVDGSDATILAGYWQYGVISSSVAVPEPGSFALIVTFLLAMGLVPTSRRNGKHRG